MRTDALFYELFQSAPSPVGKSEREVRNHVVQWVENIRQTPNLDPQTEEKLVTILSQLIELQGVGSYVTFNTFGRDN